MSHAAPGVAAPRHPPRAPTARIVALVAAVDALATLLVLSVAGTGEAGLLLWNRVLVRISFPLFLLAYSASALRALLPGVATRRLLASRRGLGLGFALAHFVHGAAIVALHATADVPPLDPAALAVGGLAFALIAAMAATSNDAAVRALGRRRWTLLHRVGLHVVWLVFTFTYLGRVARDPSFLPALALCLGAAALRATAAARRRRSPLVPAA